MEVLGWAGAAAADGFARASGKPGVCMAQAIGGSNLAAGLRDAYMAGSPVVASDWGAFTETVVPGVSGYRFSTLAEGVAATRRAMTLKRANVRRHALSRYTLERVGPQFDRWFKQLDGLWSGGWNSLP